MKNAYATNYVCVPKPHCQVRPFLCATAYQKIDRSGYETMQSDTVSIIFNIVQGMLTLSVKNTYAIQ